LYSKVYKEQDSDSMELYRYSRGYRELNWYSKVYRESDWRRRVH
jgi:hypothetical protein